MAPKIILTWHVWNRLDIVTYLTSSYHQVQSNWGSPWEPLLAVRMKVDQNAWIPSNIF
jgi:hypothetical protein